MATSPRYNELVNRIAQLETHLLPAINPAGYTDKDQDLIRSYCLLSHAEIEAYFEEIIKDTAEEAVKTWKLNPEVVTPIIFHLAFSYKMSPEKGKDSAPYSMVHLSLVNLKKVIEGNNGIKENNTQNMLKPIGFEVPALLQTSLDGLGAKRGQIAHTSFKTHSLLDPATEKTNLLQILSELKVFDEDLSKYLLSGTSSMVPFNLHLGKITFMERLKILFKGRL